MNNQFYQDDSANEFAIFPPTRALKKADGNNSPKQSTSSEAPNSSAWRPEITGLTPRRPNLLVLGASGHVAQAFLLRLQSKRADFGRLVFLDPNARVVKDQFLDHQKLDYRFIQRSLNFPEDTSYYHKLLARYAIDIVVDLTDVNTIPILEATNSAGVSYVNTALNDSERSIANVVSSLHPTRENVRKAPHIISSGMNPGVVNVWVWHGFQHYGKPSEIIHFEYDTSAPVTGWRPMITWSRQEFLTESVWEPTGLVVNGKLNMFPTNSLENREDLQPIMAPVLSLPCYPRGLLVLHEENVKLGMKLGVSSKYIYAIHPKTMDYLEQLWQKHGRIKIDDLEIGDNTTVPLSGSDTIGLCLVYPSKRIYYLHSLANSEVIGTNATCAQVAVGVEAALTTLLKEQLSPRIYFASDLYDTIYSEVVLNSLRVEHLVVKKQMLERSRRRKLAGQKPRKEFTPTIQSESAEDALMIDKVVEATVWNP